MNQSRGTAADLVAAARELFAEHGYTGASIRAITQRAGANLGAITYHFGSKDALYEAAIESVAEPMRSHLRDAAGSAGTPLERIDRMVRAMFQYLQANPAMSRLLTQQLASVRPLPGPALNTLRANIGLMASLIAEGQQDGSIRPGDPTLMALSIGSQPIFLNLVRQALREGVEIDQDDPATGKEVVESVAHFVRAGLTNQSGAK
ncbi:MAG: hypothetical protein AMS18_01115 [Gemmatimonas sp. SG8_17]|nr:MAG: hypothetical protein AMS18_01115 [Gemmatimonas sp. SG8_17]